MGMARMIVPGGGCLPVLKRTGHVVAMRTNSFRRGTEYYNQRGSVDKYLYNIIGMARQCVHIARNAADINVKI